MGLNIERLTILRDHIAQLPPSRFNMETWASTPGTDRGPFDITAGDVKHDCGTCACIGGWADALFQPEDAPINSLPRHSTEELLGLTAEQGDELFSPARDWSSITQEDAVATLTRLIETGEVNWD